MKSEADVAFTIVGAGSRVLGVGLADDVLVYLVPLVLIVTSGQRGGGEERREEEEGGKRQLGTAVENAPISGSRWRDQDRAGARGTTRTACVPETISSWRKKKKKVAAGGGAIKQHISPNAQLAKQT